MRPTTQRAGLLRGQRDREERATAFTEHPELVGADPAGHAGGILVSAGRTGEILEDPWQGVGGAEVSRASDLRHFRYPFLRLALRSWPRASWRSVSRLAASRSQVDGSPHAGLVGSKTRRQSSWRPRALQRDYRTTISSPDSVGLRVSNQPANSRPSSSRHPRQPFACSSRRLSVEMRLLTNSTVVVPSDSEKESSSSRVLRRSTRRRNGPGCGGSLAIGIARRGRTVRPAVRLDSTRGHGVGRRRDLPIELCGRDAGWRTLGVVSGAGERASSWPRSRAPHSRGIAERRWPAPRRPLLASLYYVIS